MNNLNDIRKGDTWTFTIEAFSDETEATAVDISDYQFTMTGVYVSGGTGTAFSKTNSAFVATTNFKRTFTLTKTETAALTAGEIYYQIDVTYPDTTAEQWAEGYIIVKA